MPHQRSFSSRRGHLIVSFTGTRFGMSPYQQESLLDYLTANAPIVLKVLHGGCIGADQEFHSFCISLGIPIEIYPGYSKKSPEDLTYRAVCLGAQKVHEPLPHLERNRLLVDLADIVIACPLSEERKGGTWYTYNYAHKKKKHTQLFY